MEPLVHFSFGWERDFALAVAGLVAYQLLVFAVVAVGLRCMRVQRPWRWVALANGLTAVGVVGVVHAWTAHPADGVTVAQNGAVTAHVGLARVERVLGTEATTIGSDHAPGHQPPPD